MDGEVTTDGKYFYQQVGDKLVLISQETYKLIQQKNKEKIKEHKEAEKQQWLREFGRDFSNPEETYKQFKEEKERVKRE